MNDFSAALLLWYRKHGRSHLPWRRTRDPYCIIVSEFMLQQTQVDRVLPKYEAFIARFPTIHDLARASTADVLREWKGLGYNSRAVRLHRLAREAVELFGGQIPRDPHLLQQLPGVGPYTVAAVRAFAFNESDAAMDTNIRRIVHRALFGIEFPPAAGASALDLAARALVPSNGGHDWNSAMMDLGSLICTARSPQCLICPVRPHCVAAPLVSSALEAARLRHTAGAPKAQRFEETARFARGRIVDVLRDLPAGKRISLLDLHAELAPVVQRSADEFHVIVTALARDGIVHFDGREVALPH